MSIYTISRLFKYHVALPQKIIYDEYEFRQYARDICCELQLVNNEHNLAEDLIGESGYLKLCACESLPSPLLPEACPVTKDQCMFCKKRGFKNLGRHISMLHGGQGTAIVSSRYNRS